MTASLKVTRPESMDLDSVIEWSKNAAAAGQERCREAEAYFKAMRRHYRNMTLLLGGLQRLKENAPDYKERAKEIIDTWLEVFEAMDALTNERSENGGSISLEEEEERIQNSDVGHEAVRQLDAEAKAFRDAYFHHKDRLGLKTQEDVARLTGIDRRYISEIERATHKPQFRTIKRLADAFGIPVAALMAGE